MDKILVLAGNFREYEIAKQLHSIEGFVTSNWVYAASWQTVIGRRFKKMIKVGTWESRYSAHDLRHFEIAMVSAPELEINMIKAGAMT